MVTLPNGRLGILEAGTDTIWTRLTPLAGGWAPPAQWTPVVGGSIKGKEVPKPPSAWPVGPAEVVYPVSSSRNQPPGPVVVGRVPSEFCEIALVE